MSMKKLFLLLLVMLFALFARFYWSIYGGNIVGDEPFSYSISTPSNLNDKGEIFKKKWDYFRLSANKTYKGKYLKDIFFKAHSDSLGKDLKMMYITTNDDGHSNFYYSLFRIYNSGLDDMNPTFMKMFGILFNIGLCAFAMLVMFRLLRVILKEDKHIPLAMFITFLNAGAMSCTMFVREYQLQMIFFILVSYIFAVIYDAIERGEKLYSGFRIFLYSFALALFALSAYYSEVYTVILGGVLLYKSYKNNRKDWIIALILMYLGHFLLAKMLYWGFFNFIGSQDFPQEPFDFMRIWKRIWKNCTFMYRSVFYFPVLILTPIALWYYHRVHKTFKDTKYNMFLLLAVLASIWSYIIIYIAHLDYMRYIMAGYPIMALAIVWLVVNLNTKWWSFVFGTIFFLYSLPFTLHFIPKPIASMVYFVHFNFGHMKELMKSDLPIYLKNDDKFPVYATSEVILYTSDDADIQIVSDMDYFTSKENPNDEFIVVTRIPEDFDKTDKKWQRIYRKISSQELEDYCMLSGWHCFPITKKTYYKIDKLYDEMDHEKIEAEEAKENPHEKHENKKESGNNGQTSSIDEK